MVGVDVNSMDVNVKQDGMNNIILNGIKSHKIEIEDFCIGIMAMITFFALMILVILIYG